MNRPCLRLNGKSVCSFQNRFKEIIMSIGRKKCFPILSILINRLITLGKCIHLVVWYSSNPHFCTPSLGREHQVDINWFAGEHDAKIFCFSFLQIYHVMEGTLRYTLFKISFTEWLLHQQNVPRGTVIVRRVTRYLKQGIWRKNANEKLAMFQSLKKCLRTEENYANVITTVVDAMKSTVCDIQNRAQWVRNMPGDKSSSPTANRRQGCWIPTMDYKGETLW